MPSPKDQLASFLKAAGKAAGAAVSGETLLVSEEEKARRLSICDACPKKETLIGQPRCGACGCFLKAKAALATESCPEGKWNA